MCCPLSSGQDRFSPPPVSRSAPVEGLDLVSGNQLNDCPAAKGHLVSGNQLNDCPANG